jgi:MFS transporter, DHA2 family, multidrug resistance protein
MSPTSGLPAPERRWAMLSVLLSLALSSLSSAIANIALPSIAHTFSSSDAAAIWVVNGYQLAVTVCLLPVAALSESLGLKRAYAAGLAIFTLASLGCALSPTLAVLVSARILQGFGGACISVATVALVRKIYPANIIGRGFALLAVAVAISGALGPTIAAMILAVANWPWLFLVNVPFGLLAVLVFLAVAPSDVGVARPFDWTGAILNALAFGFVIAGVATLGVGGLSVAAGEMTVGVVCFAILVKQQLRQSAPLLPLDLLRMPVFALSVGASICSYAVQMLSYVSLPFFFETVLHLTPVQTGLLVTPWPFLTAVAAPIAGRLTIRRPASVIGSIGLAVLAVGLLLMTVLPVAPTYWDIVWRLALCGVGFGLFQTPNNVTMMMAGPLERNGAASGMSAVARYVGMSLGSALAALIFGLGGSHATISCLETGAGLAVVGAIASSTRRYVQNHNSSG